MADSVRRLDVAGHPGVVAALVVLVVNDHVLKGWSRGVGGSAGVVARIATGKASDIAGVLLLTVLLGLVVGRRPAVATVGVGFTALKLFPAVGAFAEPILGGPTRTDPSDLLALIVLVPAERLLRRVPAPDLRPAGASVRATLGLAVVVLGVPAMTATSCPEGPLGLDQAAVLDDGRVVVWEGGDDSEEPSSGSDTDPPPDPAVERPPGTAVPPTTVDAVRAEAERRWTSRDGGRTWRREAYDAEARARALPEDEDGTVCAPTGCVRQGAGPYLEEQDADGLWVTSFEYSEDERAAFEANSATCNRELRPGLGEVVVVDGTVVATAGVGGIVRREPGGDWEQVSVGRWERPGDRPAPWLRSLVWSPIPALGLFVVLFWGGLARSPRRSFLRPFSVFLALLGVIGGGGVGLAVAVFGATPTELGRLVGVITAIVVGVAVVPLLPLVIWRREAVVPSGPPPGPAVEPGVRRGPEERPPPPPPPGPSGWL